MDENTLYNKISMLEKDKIYSAILLGINILFYLFFAAYDGFAIAPDSPTYISMTLYREPVYCIFLAILRTLFELIGVAHSEFYLTVAVYIQSLLAAYAIWCLAEYLRKEFILTYLQTGVVVLIPMIISLICRSSEKISMYPTSILTEGITCSLFLVYTRYLLEYLYKNSRKSLIASTVLSFILISTRKQMCITVILLAIVVCWIYFLQKRIKNGILIALLCVCCILCSNWTLETVYNYFVHGEIETHSGDNRFLATVAIYTSERSYGEEIEDDEAQELFYMIYDECNTNGYLKNSAGKGLNSRVHHFHDNYDNVQLVTMWSMIREHVYANYKGDKVYLEKKVDEITRQITKGLLPNAWKDMIGCSIETFLSGIVVTAVGIPEEMYLVLLSPIVYLLYFLLFVTHVKNEGMTKLSYLAVCVILFIVINVAVISMVIFCSPRYTIYNTPLLYIALWILIVKNVKSQVRCKRLIIK